MKFKMQRFTDVSSENDASKSENSVSIPEELSDISENIAREVME